jgi:hypothetical protein
MRKNLIPQGKAEYDRFFKNISQYVVQMTSGSTPTWTHIPAQEVTALNTAYAAWYTAYSPTLKPHIPAVTAAMQAAYDSTKKVLSRFIQVWFRGFPDIVTNDHLANMGIPPIDTTPTDIPRPSAQPEADVRYPGKHLLELVDIRAIPSIGEDPRSDWGVRIFWGVIGEPTAKDKFRLSAPPVTGDDLPHSTFTRKKKYRINFDGDSGKTVWFCLRYENEKGGEDGEGPFGPLFSAIIP